MRKNTATVDMLIVILIGLGVMFIAIEFVFRDSVKAEIDNSPTLVNQVERVVEAAKTAVPVKLEVSTAVPTRLEISTAVPVIMQNAPAAVNTAVAEPLVQESDTSVDALGGEYNYLNWDGNASQNCQPGQYIAGLHLYFDCYGNHFPTEQEAIDSYNSYGDDHQTSVEKPGERVDSAWATESYSAEFVQACAAAAVAGRRSHPDCVNALRELGPGR